MSDNLSPSKILIRCFAEKIDGQWQAFSLEFGLAAQGASLSEVRRKIEAMIVDYFNEAVTEDREYAGQLLRRRAPVSIYVKYYKTMLANRLRRPNSKKKIFQEPWPVHLDKHCPA